MSAIKEQDVVNALREVVDPELGKDIVSLSMLKDVKVEGQDIEIKVELTTGACPLKAKIQSDCESSLKKKFPSSKVIVNLTAPGSELPKKFKIPGVRNTVAVASGKGGVGKSTVAVNIALGLASQGARVGLLDADIYGPSIPLMMGLEKPQMLENPENGKIVPFEKYGIRLMSIGFLIDESSPVIWRGPMASGAVKQFMTDVDWGELDYLIFDLPPGTGDIQLTLVQTIELSGAVIVTTPQDVSLLDARKGLMMFKRVGVPVYGIIENMSYFVAPDTGKKYYIFGQSGGSRLAKESGTKLLGEIPIDSKIREGSDSGLPVVIEETDGESSKTFLEISRGIALEVSLGNLNNE